MSDSDGVMTTQSNLIGFILNSDIINLRKADRGEHNGKSESVDRQRQSCCFKHNGEAHSGAAVTVPESRSAR